MSKQIIEGTVLYTGPSYNALGDRRNQLILGLTPEMGVSILGPCHRCDKLVGDEHSGVAADRFADLDGQHFKVAAIRFLREDERAGRTPARAGLFYRTVGYRGTGDSYERDWSFAEIAEFASAIRESGTEGIVPDPYLDREWAYDSALAGVRLRLADGSLEFEVGENIPPGFGNPSINQPPEFIACNAFIREWEGGRASRPCPAEVPHPPAGARCLVRHHPHDGEGRDHVPGVKRRVRATRERVRSATLAESGVGAAEVQAVKGPVAGHPPAP